MDDVNLMYEIAKSQQHKSLMSQGNPVSERPSLQKYIRKSSNVRCTECIPVSLASSPPT